MAYTIRIGQVEEGRIRTASFVAAIFIALLSQVGATTAHATDPCGAWESIAPMSVERAEHGLVTLKDGRVLAVGGHTGRDPKTNTTSEVYDLSTNSWGAVATLLEPRQESERPRLLHDGAVMLAGGHGGTCCDALTQVDLYDPESGQWCPAGPMNHRRGEHAVVVLKLGNVLVVGGFDWGTETAPRPAEIYSIASRTWRTVDEFPEPGLVNIAVLLANGKVLVKGDMHSARCFLFDPETETFSETGNLVAERMRPTFNLLQDGRVLAAGGEIGNAATRTAEIYDPATGQWSATGDMIAARIRHTATLLDDGRVLIVGGHEKAAHDSAELYDPKSESWTETAKMAERRTSHEAAKLQDGRVLVSGGWTLTVSGRTSLLPTLASAEIFDPEGCNDH